MSLADFLAFLRAMGPGPTVAAFIGSSLGAYLGQKVRTKKLRTLAREAAGEALAVHEENCIAMRRRRLSDGEGEEFAS